jgi:hypothetical protein
MAGRRLSGAVRKPLVKPAERPERMQKQTDDPLQISDQVNASPGGFRLLRI